MQQIDPSHEISKFVIGPDGRGELLEANIANAGVIQPSIVPCASEIKFARKKNKKSLRFHKESH